MIEVGGLWHDQRMPTPLNTVHWMVSNCFGGYADSETMSEQYCSPPKLTPRVVNSAQYARGQAT